MTEGFWAGAALLVVAAVALLWLPVMRARRRARQDRLSRREQNVEIFRERIAELEGEVAAGRLEAEQFAALSVELQRNLLAETEGGSEPEAVRVPRAAWAPALALSIALPAAALLLYDNWGALDDLALSGKMQRVAESGGEGQRAHAIEDLLAGLEERVRKDPDNLQDRYLLARSYLELGRFGDAAKAYEGLLGVAGERPELLAEYGQAAFFAADRTMTGPARRALSRALELDPANRTALGVLGIGAFEERDWAQAVEYWERALEVTTDGPGREALERGLASARSRLGASGGSVAAAPAARPAAAAVEPTPGPSAAAPSATAMSAAATSAAAPSIRVLVEVDPEVRAKVGSGAPVFVFARSPQGPPMPLAVARMTVGDLPTLVTLDDSMAMAPMARLSMAEQVNVTARISLGGTPQVQAGDFQAGMEDVPVRGQSGVLKLLIRDKVI